MVETDGHKTEGRPWLLVMGGGGGGGGGLESSWSYGAPGGAAGGEVGGVLQGAVKLLEHPSLGQCLMRPVSPIQHRPLF